MEEEIKRAPGGTRVTLTGMLGDPPLIDRVTWREGIHSPTLTASDRGLMARTYGTLYLVGAVVTGLSLVLPGALHDALLGAISVFCVVAAAVLFVLYRRTPIWGFQLANATGTVLVAFVLYEVAPGADGGYTLFYVWVVLMAFAFFDLRAAIAQTLFAVATYVVVLIARDQPFAANYLLALTAVLAATGAVVALLRTRLERLAEGLATQALTDPVTEIANRRSFESRFDFEVTAAEQTGAPLSLLICDLDRFKAVNDELGHEEGDGALRLAADTIAGAVRTVDVVFRLGGEEFAVLLPNTGPLEAYAVAERIRMRVRDAFMDFEVPLTISCGLATRLGDGLDRQGLMRAADDALYNAKRAGRDRTVPHDPQTLEASSVK